ncbi:hypothetical protein DL89DRAFT_253981 [Linderina pennispora]|uniref:Uncharacterized protein n=1 Tax=Linderina pennispora TaxID=61395 RepID=A0A1Y1WL52_9FUNG|nr:uncharacterized protein DL89DRAFT_253981 [Linderina pennispora]ORX74095.1 hypothetical protein DL89DRAFT_253981 [Linderina pennispora]
MALIGGQSGSGTNVDEARRLLDVFRPLLTDYLAKMSAFLDNEAHDSRVSILYEHGLDVLKWCTHAELQPSHGYLTRASVELPLAGLLQLMHVMILYKTLGINPGDLTRHFKAREPSLPPFLHQCRMRNHSTHSRRRLLASFFLCGAIPDLECPDAEVDLALTDESISNEGPPSPMVSIRGIAKDQLSKFITEFNERSTGTVGPVYLSLVNTNNRIVVSGSTRSVAVFVQWLRGKCAQHSDDQSHIPYSQRKPIARMTFLSISQPYHCDILLPTIGRQLSYAAEKGWAFDAADLRTETRATNDGHDLRHWAPMSTHIVDFSPDGFSAFGTFAHSILAGRGISVISTSALTAGSSPLGAKAELFKQNISEVIQAPNWQKQFAPRLVRTKHDGRLHLDTPMHRILGQPPLMVAGMMPTTANEHFVAAVKNAGYHAELGGAGIYSKQMLRRMVDNLVLETAPGQGITLNCIYFNQRLWNFQYAEILRLRSEGYPIAGVCIGAGVPSLEVTSEIIGSFRNVGIRHVAFKPGTAAAIRQVLQIARTNSDFPVILQWTGGRGGGHHSCEDFHEPILDTYAKIRAQNNVVLVLGSGFGDAEGTLPYLTGNWSLKYGCAPMPVDGFLVASRVMISKEAKTSTAAKKLIAQASGLANSEWEKTYSGAHGGVVTTFSEYGELMHVIATRGAIFIKELHETVLSKPREEQPKLLNARKDYIIQRLNSDHVRPWFGQKADGSTCDLEEMTYMEVANRLAGLLYVKHQQRWIDPSYLDLFSTFLRHAENRFTRASVCYEVQFLDEIGDPNEMVSHFATKYPDIATTVISSEDVQYFLHSCRRRGMKPVPFIPLFDEDFAVWLLKDTFRQCEDADALVDQDIQRTFILHGPLSARYSTKVDEPVKDILDGIYNGQTSAFLDWYYGGDKSRVPVVEYISPSLQRSVSPCTVPRKVLDDRSVYYLPTRDAELPDLNSWVTELVGTQEDWLHALLTSTTIVQGLKYADNHVPRIVRPRPGQVVTLFVESGTASRLTISQPGLAYPEVELRIDESSVITVCVNHATLDKIYPWELNYRYRPDMPSAMIHDANKGRDSQFCLIPLHGAKHSTECYQDNVLGQEVGSLPSSGRPVRWRGFVITDELVAKYCKSVGNRLSLYKPHSARPTYAPTDLLFVISTEGMFSLFSLPLASPGFLNLVHRSNQMELADNFELLKVGDVVDYDICIGELFNTVAGKQLQVQSVFYKDGETTPLHSSMSPSRCISLRLNRSWMSTFLRSKEWIMFHEEQATDIAPGDALEFVINSKYRYLTDTVYSSMKSVGSVRLVRRNSQSISLDVASIQFEWLESTGNPVVGFLERVGHIVDHERLFDHEGVPIIPADIDGRLVSKAPNSALEYAAAAGDFNPIHTNAYIADHAGLPSPIIHGMWTSASTRAFIERYAANSQPERIRAYSTEFVDMVQPGDQLQTKLFHVGMKNGRMLVKGETCNQHGNVVLTCIAEVDQPRTVYTFAGLGSQQVGMGMDLYAQSDAAHNVWDRADKHMCSTYGVSLLDIVRNNPKRLVVKFCGKKGLKVQQVYQSLATETIDDNGEASMVELFPQASGEADDYTHLSASGLLHAAQFTQPALAVFAMANIAHLKSKSLLQERAMFAGHSLGEFCALAALSDIFTLEDIIDITFYRGMLLHASVERDQQSRSQYGMAAINPSRVGESFDQDSLAFVVKSIGVQGGALLELINYNVAGHQYVVTGHHSMLSALREVLDTIHACRIDVTSDFGKCDVENIIRGVIAHPDRDTRPTRGRASIPLEGVDVPSHSTQLLPAVAPFRRYLKQKLTERNVDYSKLQNIYIPNVTAKPFEVTRDYFELVHEVTKSPVLAEELANWGDGCELSDPEIARLAPTLLVELLAYHRFIEISPTPTLTGMANKTLELLASIGTKPSVLHILQDEADICFAYEPSSEETNIGTTPVDNAEKLAPQQVDRVEEPATHRPPASLPTAPAKSVPDIPLQTLDVLQVLIALKMKKPARDILPTKTIKELARGQSTLQNEIVNELQKEFGSAVPNKAEEMNLTDLADKIGLFSGTPGKQLNAHLARLFATKMPGNYSQSILSAHLESRYGLGVQRQNAVLLLALTLAPPSRLGTAYEELYAKHEGIVYSADISEPVHSTASVLSSAELDKAQHLQKQQLLRQMAVLAHSAGVDLHKDKRELAQAQSEIAKLQAEIDKVSGEQGDEYLQGISSIFDAKKGRHYNSYWNWARQDLFELWNGLLRGNRFIDSEKLHMLKNRSSPALVRFAEGLLAMLKRQADYQTLPFITELVEVINSCKPALASKPQFKGVGAITGPSVEVFHDSIVSANFRGHAVGEILYSEVARPGDSTFSLYSASMENTLVDGKPLLHMRTQEQGQSWSYSREHTAVYFDAMNDTCSNGMSFEGKTVLLTGCGRGSIGSEILKGLLSGGARVAATTSSYSYRTTEYFEDMYRQYGSRGSELHVFPFNQGSVSDIDSLIQHIFGEGGLHWDLDFVLPFASTSNIGSDVTSLKSHSELALRIMMTNVIRLVGAVAAAKASLGLELSPSVVVLPLSPNHGLFGGDGFYGESKASLETLLNRWRSETWSEYISIIGAVIGWTRGTGIMDSNDVIASEVERLGMRTFSVNEMAFNILCLLHYKLRRLAVEAPLWADLAGGFQAISHCMDKVSAMREVLVDQSVKWRALFADHAHENNILSGEQTRKLWTVHNSDFKANSGMKLPVVKAYEQLEETAPPGRNVVTGYGEIGPYGHASTRWEMEAYGELSLEGCVELAWIMGLIRHHSGPLPNGSGIHIGWVDTKTGEPVRDRDIKAKYESFILQHTGIRLLEPENTHGISSEILPVLREIQVTHDMEPFEATAEEAESFKLLNGDKVDTWRNNDGTCFQPVGIRSDTGSLMIWSNSSIRSQSIALLPPSRHSYAQEVTDPYELYQYFHLADIGNTIGSGLGGCEKRMCCRRTLINTVAAWVNMLLLVFGRDRLNLLVDAAVEAIQLGKAKMVVAGASDTFTRENALGFASINRHSRCYRSSLQTGAHLKKCLVLVRQLRNGFVESAGAGILTLMSASAAIECGAPIYGVLAMTATATDKEGRTVPAPGQGLLTTVREDATSIPSPLLDFAYRRCQLTKRLNAIQEWVDEQYEGLEMEIEKLMGTDASVAYNADEFARSRKSFIESKSQQLIRDAHDAWRQFHPLRGSLAMWGLTVDDIGVVSFHATSTKASDKNEPHVINQQLKKLGRTPGYAVPAVCQKYLTGHSKGPAAAWMLNGVLQSMQTGIIPGNRNLDNVDPELEKYDCILFPCRSIQTPRIDAALVTSFGFGQVGAEILVLNPDFVHAVLSKDVLDKYRCKVKEREQKSNRYWQDVLIGNHMFAQIKSAPPFTPDQEVDIYMDPTARARYDPVSKGVIRFLKAVRISKVPITGELRSFYLGPVSGLA